MYASLCRCNSVYCNRVQGLRHLHILSISHTHTLSFSLSLPLSLSLFLYLSQLESKCWHSFFFFFGITIKKLLINIETIIIRIIYRNIRTTLFLIYLINYSFELCSDFYSFQISIQHNSQFSLIIPYLYAHTHTSPAVGIDSGTSRREKPPPMPCSNHIITDSGTGIEVASPVLTKSPK